MRRIISSSPQMNYNPDCPPGFLAVTARWQTRSGTGESRLFVEATNYQDAFATVRADFKLPPWDGYTLLTVTRES